MSQVEIINELNELSKEYQVPKEDILFIYLSIKGVNVPVEYARVRFIFHCTNTDIFTEANARNIDRFFLALPVLKTSEFSIRKEDDYYLYVHDTLLGKVTELLNDTCDTEYTRNCGTVINLNPVSKSSCKGCKFCHTVVQNANDRGNTKTCEGLEAFVKEWVTKRNRKTLSDLVQIALVTGTFGGSQAVLNYCELIRKTFGKYDYSNEILYFGSEVDIEDLSKRIDILNPFAWCYTVECFENRDFLLKKEKRKNSLDSIFQMLGRSCELGVKTNFSYILGIDSLATIKTKFSEVKDYINRFPIVNIFQPHENIKGDILCKEASDIRYYIEARLIMEEVFKNTDMRPRTWENYRSPWYLRFAGEELNGNRLP